jgi:hypothetical protein
MLILTRQSASVGNAVPLVLIKFRLNTLPALGAADATAPLLMLDEANLAELASVAATLAGLAGPALKLLGKLPLCAEPSGCDKFAII